MNMIAICDEHGNVTPDDISADIIVGRKYGDDRIVITGTCPRCGAACRFAEASE